MVTQKRLQKRANDRVVEQAVRLHNAVGQCEFKLRVIAERMAHADGDALPLLEVERQEAVAALVEARRAFAYGEGHYEAAIRPRLDEEVVD